MKNFLPEPSQQLKTSFKIKGRMIPREEVACRLRNYCSALGFGPATLYVTDLPANGCLQAGEWQARWSAGEDVALVYSLTVDYNPHWGGRGGLPQLLHHTKSAGSSTVTSAEFIAPFLQRYRFAQENIYIGRSENGQYLLTVPTCLLSKGDHDPGWRMKIHVDRFSDSGEGGEIHPVSSCGAYHSYAISPAFCESLVRGIGDWVAGRKQPIGSALTRELFSYVVDEKVFTPATPYVATLLPAIRDIVTHPTPNLRAAQIHLQLVFARDVARLAAEHPSGAGKLLYAAGLVIDMTEFAEGGEQYFVPWQAYVEPGGMPPGNTCLLEQDDLCVHLKQQDTLCPA